MKKLVVCMISLLIGSMVVAQDAEVGARRRGGNGAGTAISRPGRPGRPGIESPSRPQRPEGRPGGPGGEGTSMSRPGVHEGGTAAERPPISRPGRPGLEGPSRPQRPEGRPGRHEGRPGRPGMSEEGAAGGISTPRRSLPETPPNHK